MEDAYSKFKAFTGFIKKDDKRGNGTKAELRRNKYEGDGKKKESKKGRKKEK